MKRWWQLVISTPLCLAALALAAFLPIRAIFVYGLMGTFADRLRAVQTYRKSMAQTQKASETAPFAKPHRTKPPRNQAPE
jgi:hypothetical protein